MSRWFLGAIAVLVLAAAGAWIGMDAQTRGLLLNLPTHRDVLFWSQDTRDAAFRAMDRLPILAKVRDVPASGAPSALPAGEPLTRAIDVDTTMREQRMAAIVVVHDGKVRLERYGLDFDATGRWTSFSVAKSLTSTLVGAAVRDGHIRSLDDALTVYVRDLAGSVYEDVTIRQLLTMTSGVEWNEDYADPRSDVARFNEHRPTPGMDATVSYMRTLKRAAPPGQRWLYSTGETNLIGVVVSAATGRPLAQYLSEKIWQPFGMEQKATWILGRTGHEISGCCVQAATRDMARVGLFMLAGGRIDGKPVLPDDWIARATVKQADIGTPGKGYGYQWWTYDDGSYAGQGIFGQGLFIDPTRRLVIATNGDWPRAHYSAGDASGLTARRDAFYRAVQAAVDAR